MGCKVKYVASIYLACFSVNYLDFVFCGPICIFGEWPMYDNIFTYMYIIYPYLEVY